ncbi:MAG: hypothetical protein ABIP64_14015 [Burkholderiales bacterium]
MNGTSRLSGLPTNRRTLSHYGGCHCCANQEYVQIDWTWDDTDVFLGRPRAAKADAVHRIPLDPDGWLARFIRSQLREKQGAVEAGRELWSL